MFRAHNHSLLSRSFHIRGSEALHGAGGEALHGAGAGPGPLRDLGRAAAAPCGRKADAAHSTRRAALADCWAPSWGYHVTAVPVFQGSSWPGSRAPALASFTGRTAPSPLSPSVWRLAPETAGGWGVGDAPCTPDRVLGGPASSDRGRGRDTGSAEILSPNSHPAKAKKEAGDRDGPRGHPEAEAVVRTGSLEARARLRPLLKINTARAGRHLPDGSSLTHGLCCHLQGNALPMSSSRGPTHRTGPGIVVE